MAATVDGGEEEGRPSDAPRDGLPASGGAASFVSPERRRRRADAAESSAHGGVDSGDGVAFWRPICGEEVEGATAEQTVSVDPSGEGRCGKGARRRRRGVRPSRGREREGGGLCGFFAEKPMCLLEFAIRSLASRYCGLRVRFSFSRGTFLQKRHRRVVRAVGSPADGRDRRTVVL